MKPLFSINKGDDFKKLCEFRHKWDDGWVCSKCGVRKADWVESDIKTTTRRTSAMKKDKLLNQAISECESFLLECKTYNKRINESSTATYRCIERGTLKARSLLLIRKLQAWRKGGSVE